MSRHSRPPQQRLTTEEAAASTSRSFPQKQPQKDSVKVKKGRRDRKAANRRNRETRQSSVDVFKDAKRSVWASRVFSVCLIIFVVAALIAVFFVTKDYIGGERDKSYRNGFSQALEIEETEFPDGNVEGLLKTGPDTIFDQAKEFPGSGIPGNANLSSARVAGIQVPSGTVASSYAEIGMCLDVPGSGEAPFVAVASTANYKIKEPEWTVGSVSAGGGACQTTNE